MGPGAVLCYGGTVGHNWLDDLGVQSLVAGDYTGVLWCGPWWARRAYLFSPGDIKAINDTCSKLEITPPRG